MNTPVLFIIFKRFDTASKVFKAIRNARPPKLYVAADAPRNEEEGIECKKTRDIIKQVDWDCEVKILFQQENQGCGIGPFKAISWFFANEESGIILEDDCLPHPDFFEYCEILLKKYNDNNSITLITGRNNFKSKQENSYFLSAMHFCWGWASWRRAWQEYDYQLKDVTPFKYFKALVGYFGLQNIFTIMWRMNIYFFCKKNCPKDIWDYQFCIITQLHGGHTIVPNQNLISNIGNDERATHTSGIVEDIPIGPILPLKHPQVLKYDKTLDIVLARDRYNKLRTLYHFVRNIFHI